MKKVCFVTPRTYYLFNPDISDKEIIPGGAQTQVYYISKALAEDNNFEVHFSVADFGQTDFEIYNNIKLHKTFRLTDNIFRKTVKLIKSLKKTDAETYIFRSADIGVAFAVFWIKKILKKQTLYMLASDVEISRKRHKKFSGFLTAFSMNYVYKNADIITSQTTQQALLLKKYRNRKPDAVIKNIYPEKQKHKINNKEKDTILWVGRLTKIKKPELFLDLAKQFPDEKFVMIAPTAVNKKEYGIHIIKKIEKIKNIRYLKYIAPLQIVDYYRKAKIYILSSDFEGFPNTMAEAMQAECPILSYNVNPDNILNKYRCGFCADKNINKFYEDFEKLLKNPELSQETGKNGAKYIAENHQKNQIINNFKKLL